jgi:tetraacyldisaccharide 4'-kinase
VATIVIGNLTAGGTGKTPFVIALSDLLSSEGLRVGIVTRGYGGHAQDWPREVFADSNPREVGDEAVLLAQYTGIPVYAGPGRLAAAQALHAKHPVDVLISDDGLQHDQMGRDIEIVMIDPQRGFGNEHCLPAGPLREPLTRLGSVDATVALGEHPAARFNITAVPGDAVNLTDQTMTRPLATFANRPCHAVAGISNPERFFQTLRKQGLNPLETVAFDDHHDFIAADIRFEDDFPVLITAKDAVKCRDFAGNNIWYVPLELDIGPAFRKWLFETLKRKTDLG